MESANAKAADIDRAHLCRWDLRREHAGREVEEGEGVRIIIEFEPPGDSRSLFRVIVADKVVDNGLTAAQAHILVGDILERLTLPDGRGKAVKLSATKPK
jgi:hypothetical protein